MLMFEILPLLLPLVLTMIGSPAVLADALMLLVFDAGLPLAPLAVFPVDMLYMYGVANGGSITMFRLFCDWFDSSGEDDFLIPVWFWLMFRLTALDRGISSFEFSLLIWCCWG